MQPPLPPRSPASDRSSFQMVADKKLDQPSSLMRVLSNPNSTAADIQDLKRQYNPETFSQSQVMIGDMDSKCLIVSVKAFEAFCSHLKTYGTFFPKIRFVNCSFSLECHRVLTLFLDDCHGLKSLTFEKCMLADKQLAEIISMLCLLTKNLEEFAIIRNGISIQSQAIESLELLLQLPSAISVVNLTCNDLQDAAIAILAKSLEDNHQIHSLHLDDNKISFKGASALAHWIKTHPEVRKCSLVRNPLTDEDQRNLEQLVERRPTPFIFIANPPPQIVSQKEWEELFQDMLAKDGRYTKNQAEVLKTIKDLSQRNHLFKQWLEKSFELVPFGAGDDVSSFFTAIANGYNIPSLIRHDGLFHLCMTWIVGNIDDFTSTLIADFPRMPDKVDMAIFFQEQVHEGKWPENTFKLAIQKIWEYNGYNRPIHIFTPTVLPEVTENGALLPPVDFRIEVKNMDPLHPILLYFDGKGNFSLMLKKQPNIPIEQRREEVRQPKNPHLSEEVD